MAGSPTVRPEKRAVSLVAARLAVPQLGAKCRWDEYLGYGYRGPEYSDDRQNRGVSRCTNFGSGRWAGVGVAG